MLADKIVTLLQRWFKAHARDLPWRHTRDPYAIWVSEIMLQQTQVKTVIPYWERWMRALPNVEALARVRPGRLHKLWEGLGYYTRVRNLQRAAKIICERHSGRFPSQFDQVLDLPGVGRYTAGAICSIAYNQPAPILDGNVIRVLARLFCVEGDPRGKPANTRLWVIAEHLVRRAAVQRPTPGLSYPASSLNQALMELGALVCTPRAPQCTACPLKAECLALRGGRVRELPQLAPRARATPRRFLAFVVERQGKFLVRQRPAGIVNAHLWEFPNIEVTGEAGDPQEAARLTLGGALDCLRPLRPVKHSITRYRIALEGFHGRIKTPEKARALAGGVWLPGARLSSLPFTSAHKQLLHQLPEAKI